jgi:hypothetical protein
MLAQMGFCPIILERGNSRDRTVDTLPFGKRRTTQPESNVQLEKAVQGHSPTANSTVRSKILSIMDARC